MNKYSIRLIKEKNKINRSNGANEKESLLVKSIIFYIIWFIALSVCVYLYYYSGIGIAQYCSFQFYYSIAFIIILFIPFMNKLKIGNFFELEFSKLNEKINEIKSIVVRKYNQFNNVGDVINIENGPLTSHLPPERINNISEIKSYFSDNMEKVKLTNTINERLTVSDKYLKLGHSLFYQGRLKEAIDKLKASLELECRNWNAAMLLGLIYIILYDYVNDSENEFCLDKKQAIENSLFYSKLATEHDPNHYNQFMNLGLAFLKLNGENSLKISIMQFTKAFDILNNDNKTNKLPGYIVERGKVKNFMGDAYRDLEEIDKAIDCYELAIKILSEIKDNNYLTIAQKWSDNAKKQLENINRSKG